ncbi:MAG: TolC family protein [Thermodesulfobacteriota bacterium]
MQRKTCPLFVLALTLLLPPPAESAEDLGGDRLPAAAPYSTPPGEPPVERPEGPSSPEPTGDLQLRDALALALERSPDLQSFSWRLRAAEAREIQAALLPNPQLGVRTEDIGVSGETRGIDQAELTIELGQLIELGGKRAARVELASRGRDIAAWDYEIERIDVLARVARAFVGVLVAQEQASLAEESVRLAREVVDAVALRVRAGSTSTVEQTKAEVAVASATVELEETRRALDVARRELASTWGSTTPAFTRAAGRLDRLTPVPALPVLEARIADSPSVARWTSELLERRAALDLERSRAVPDVTASGGYRRLFDPDENTFVVGLSIPLPVLNRNQGAIEEAEHRLQQARAEQESTRVRVTAALDDAYQALATARAQIATLDRDVLPGAREAFATLNAGYLEGRFSYLEVLDAQRTLIAARARRALALGDYQRAVVALERLLGEPLAGDVPSIGAAED